MPFIRISLKKGKNKEFIKALSNSVHQALVSALKIPKKDIFQVIAEHNEENIIYPDSYLGIKHTSNIIYIVIILKAGRTTEMKKTLYKHIVNNIADSTNHNKGDIFIALTENSIENWSFGNGEAQLIKA